VTLIYDIKKCKTLKEDQISLTLTLHSIKPPRSVINTMINYIKALIFTKKCETLKEDQTINS